MRLWRYSQRSKIIMTKSKGHREIAKMEGLKEEGKR